MDGVGNRTSVVDDGKVTTYATNSVNEHVYVDNQRLMYDRNGNMTSDGNLQMFYDHNNMLVEIKTPEYIFHQRFDAIGRRLMVQFTDGLTETRYFWHDGQQVVYEEVSGLTEPYRYVWGNGIDEALVRFGNGDIWYLDNQLGSVMALTNDAGQVIESYSYDVYGAVTAYDAAGQQISMTNYDNRYLSTGREYNWHTGLYHYRARTYHPYLGRFLSRDPLPEGGVCVSEESAHVHEDVLDYLYAGSRPVNLVDNMGLHPQKQVFTVKDWDDNVIGELEVKEYRAGLFKFAPWGREKGPGVEIKIEFRTRSTAPTIRCKCVGPLKLFRGGGPPYGVSDKDIYGFRWIQVIEGKMPLPKNWVQTWGIKYPFVDPPKVPDYTLERLWDEYPYYYRRKGKEVFRFFD